MTMKQAHQVPTGTADSAGGEGAFSADSVAERPGSGAGTESRQQAVGGRRVGGGGGDMTGGTTSGGSLPAETASPCQPPNDLQLSGPPTCTGCGRTIADRYLHQVLGGLWHAACLVCTDCRLPLRRSCFQNEAKLYCGEHFFRRFGTRCAGCGEGVPPSELVRRAHDNVYHLACFVCAVCDTKLDTGDQFYLRSDNSLVCKADYDNARQKCGGNPEDDDDDDQPTKRPRASINGKQLEELRSAYNISRKPSRNMREELSKKLGLDMRVVQVWFQNRRAKEKRLKKDVGGAEVWGSPDGGSMLQCPDVKSDSSQETLCQGGDTGPGQFNGLDTRCFPNPMTPKCSEAPSSVLSVHHTPPGCTWTSSHCQQYMENNIPRDAFSSPPDQGSVQASSKPTDDFIQSTAVQGTFMHLPPPIEHVGSNGSPGGQKMNQNPLQAESNGAFNFSHDAPKWPVEGHGPLAVNAYGFHNV